MTLIVKKAVVTLCLQLKQCEVYTCRKAILFALINTDCSQSPIFS